MVPIAPVFPASSRSGQTARGSLPLGRQPNRGRPHLQGAPTALAIEVGRSRSRLGLAPHPCQQHCHRGFVEGRDHASKVGVWTRAQRRGTSAAVFAVNDVPDTATWMVRGNGRSSLTHKGWTWTDLWSQDSGTVRLLGEPEASSLDSLSWSHAPVMGDLALTLSPQHIQGISWDNRTGSTCTTCPCAGRRARCSTMFPTPIGCT